MTKNGMMVYIFESRDIAFQEADRRGFKPDDKTGDIWPNRIQIDQWRLTDYPKNTELKYKPGAKIDSYGRLIMIGTDDSYVTKFQDRIIDSFSPYKDLSK